MLQPTGWHWSQSTHVLVLNRRFDAAPEDFPFQEPEQGVGVDELNAFVSKFPIKGLTFSADGQRVATWHLQRVHPALG
jgi:hypothetical protein